MFLWLNPSCNMVKNHKTIMTFQVLYSAIFIKRTGSLNYFEVFAPPCLQLLDPVRLTNFEKKIMILTSFTNYTKLPLTIKKTLLA